MPNFVRTLVCCLSLLSAGPTLAATLDWDRNAEPDMKDYQVYGCFTANCVLIKSSSTLLGTVVQTASGVRPSMAVLTAGKEGSLGVVARDQSLNESGLSVPLNFDQVAPQSPVGLTLR